MAESEDVMRMEAAGQLYVGMDRDSATARIGVFLSCTIDEVRAAASGYLGDDVAIVAAPKALEETNA
jgi:hypothetical protein